MESNVLIKQEMLVATSLPWWVLHTKANHEETVRVQLAQKEYICYLPKYRRLSKRKDRTLFLSSVLFPGYVFVQTILSKEDKISLLRCIGVSHILGIQNKPVPVREQEIENVKLMLSTERMIEPLEIFPKGKDVIVIDGPLTGVVGRIFERKNSRFLVCQIELLGRSVMTELQEDLVRPL